MSDISTWKKLLVLSLLQIFNFLGDFAQNALYVRKSWNRKILIKCSFLLLLMCTISILNCNRMQNNLLIRKDRHVLSDFSHFFTPRGTINFFWNSNFLHFFTDFSNFVIQYHKKCLYLMQMIWVMLIWCPNHHHSARKLEFDKISVTIWSHGSN